ncbi:P-type conjugative transfer protein TrbL [Acidocella sp.]|uniref:P-type conjugative transfer protein TrbL n=1 Tax=Acidocella sp. TaxID=50710 RepID=UPI003D06C436
MQRNRVSSLSARAILGAITVVVMAMAMTHAAWAATPPSAAIPASLAPAAIVNDIVTTYKNATSTWITPLQNIAEKLFWTLAGIEVAWSISRILLRGGDIAEIVIELIQQIVVIGFFYGMLSHFPEYAQDVIVGLQDAASSVGGVSLANPGNIFTVALNIVTKVTSDMAYWKVGADIALAIAAMAMMIIFALITANIVFVVIEAHFAVAAGIIFMGLGGSRWTNTYALSVIRYVMSIAAKLFVMELVVGIGQTIITQFANQIPDASWASILALLGAVVVFYVLMKGIPDLVQGIINGGNLNTGMGMSAATAALAGAAAGAMAGGAGALSAASEASQLAAAAGGGAGAEGAAGALGAAASGGAGESAAGGASSGGGSSLGRGQLMARTAGILGRAAMADMQGRLEGDPASRGGTMGGRMARRIRSANTSKSDVPRLTPDP